MAELCLPPRILRFRLRLARFDYDIEHIPGKHLYTADTLSRSPLPTTGDKRLEELTETAVRACVSNLPASQDRLKNFLDAQKSDKVCTLVAEYCRKGWPKKHNVTELVRPYWEVRGELTLCNDLLLYNTRIVVPTSMQLEMLSKLHQGHQGIERCRQRAQISVWWPGISSQIEEWVKMCQRCAKVNQPRKEPLMPSALPTYPWQKVGTDLFVLKQANYLVVVDYFSRYPEVIKLTSTTSQSVIVALKSTFGRHGIPEIVVSDNGPQYSSHEFSEFAKTYSFSHITSSPHYPQSNGHAERAVKTVKKLLTDADDPCLSLLAYRTTPLPWCGYSPSELLMGRRIRSDVPQVHDKLVPNWPYLPDFRRCDDKFKQKQKRDFDR